MSCYIKIKGLPLHLALKICLYHFGVFVFLLLVSLSRKQTLNCGTKERILEVIPSILIFITKNTELEI